MVVLLNEMNGSSSLRNKNDLWHNFVHYEKVYVVIRWASFASFQFQNSLVLIESRLHVDSI
jgi:hypothetical protein